MQYIRVSLVFLLSLLGVGAHSMSSFPLVGSGPATLATFAFTPQVGQALTIEQVSLRYRGGTDCSGAIVNTNNWSTGDFDPVAHPHFGVTQAAAYKGITPGASGTVHSILVWFTSSVESLSHFSTSVVDCPSAGSAGGVCYCVPNVTCTGTLTGTCSATSEPTLVGFNFP